MLLRLARDLIDFCYPGVCNVCQGGCEPGAFLCGACLARLEALERGAACTLCGMPIARDDAPCPFCEGRGVPHYERIVRLGPFDHPLKDLIHTMKYHGRWTLGEHLAGRLIEQARALSLVTEAQVIVAVPLHPFRQFRRGFNQAAVVARCLARRANRPIARPIRRVRYTETQTHLHSRARRFANLKGAFRLVNPASIRGKRVLVIDDVMTTGATLQTVARTLRQAEPESLSALVLAVADPRGRGFQRV